MTQDTTYAPIPIIYKSRGLIARTVTDQAPPNFYLNMMNCLEREEEAMSSRYGVSMITRDPNGTIAGVNYPLPAPINSLARLTYQGTPHRYAGLTNGELFR